MVRGRVVGQATVGLGGRGESFLQLKLRTQQPFRRPRRVDRVVGIGPSGTTTWVTGGMGENWISLKSYHSQYVPMNRNRQLNKSLIEYSRTLFK